MDEIPYIQVQVCRWKSASEQQFFTFTKDKNDSNTINETIYCDDNIETAVTKIARYIEKTQPFYAWVHKKPLLFTIKDKKWKEYNVNPFKSSNHTSDTLNESLQYSYNINELFNYKSINIVFAKDLPVHLRSNPYYFSDLEHQSYEYYKKRDQKLLELQNTISTSVIPQQEFYSRINLKSCLKKPLEPSILFNNIKTSDLMNMVQWVDDKTRILYKLSKNHKIKDEYFNSWISIDKIDKTNVVNIYSILNKNTYCKVSIDNLGNIFFNYVLTGKEHVKISSIDKHIENVVDKIQSYNSIQKKIKLDVISLNSKIRIEAHNSSFKTLLKIIGQNIDIFHITKSETNAVKQYATCIYKRSSNYTTDINIYDYIKTMIDLAIPKNEIVEEMRSLGITGNLEEMVDNEIDNMLRENNYDKKPFVNLKEIGTYITIFPYSYGYDISIVNCVNTEEHSYLIYWLSKIIAKSIDKNRKVSKPDKNDIQQKSNSSKSDSHHSSSSSSSKSDIVVFDFDDEQYGGVVKKKIDLINMLQQADNSLFYEGYAREKCQSQKQPIVLSKEKKKEIEDNGDAHWDNIIEYGSTTNNLNYYTCPRLWCPESKIPLSPDDPNAKCPIDGEVPTRFFWKDNKDKKRYVSLIKPNVSSGVCYPCCSIKQPAQKDLDKCNFAINKNTQPIQHPRVENQDNENNLLNQVAPLEKNRFGTIPKYLHDIMFHGKNIEYSLCSKVLYRTHNCLVRKGIENNRKHDSCIFAVMDILNFDNKHAFINDIVKKLDMITFISLNEGKICKDFMSIREIIPERNLKLNKKFEIFKKKYPKLYNIDTINLSRSLNIFHSYTQYVAYISSNDFKESKEPEYLFPLVSVLYNVHILLWEKKAATNELFLNCPSLNIVSTNFNPIIGMVMKESKYYEPLVLKMRKSDDIKTFPINEYEKLKSIVMKCNNAPDNVDSIYMYNNIYALFIWTKGMLLKNNELFVIDKIFINDNLTINKVMTKGNIIIYFDTIGISMLSRFIKDMNIATKNIVFYSDYVSQSYELHVMKSDLGKFAAKCHEIGVKFDLGVLKNTINKETQLEYYTTLTLSEEKKSNDMIIHTNTYNGFYSDIYENEKNVKKWHEMKKMVGKILLEKFTDASLKKLNRLNWESKQQQLQGVVLEHHSKMPQKQLMRIKIILEEIPTDSIDSINKWLYDTLVFSSTKIKDNKKEFFFSQNALISNGRKHVPKYLLSYHVSSPNEKPDNMVVEKKIEINSQDVKTEAVLPSIFIGKETKLPTRWILQKKSIWNNMMFVDVTNYTHNTIKQFIIWLIGVIKMPIVFEDIVENMNVMYYQILKNDESFIKLLGDNSFKREWVLRSGKVMDSPKQIMSSFFTTLTDSKKEDVLKDIIDKRQLYPTNITMLSISELLNISILIINRAEYGKADNTKNRKDVSNLVASSVFFPAKYNMNERPMLIFYKQHDDYKSIYYIVLEKETKKIYLKYQDIPEGIKVLTKEHIKLSQL